MSIIPDNPNSYIKNPIEMGITGKGDDESINNTLNAFAQYNNALYSGKTSALKIDTNGEPLGNRYFAKVGIYNENGEKTDRYISVDNMKYSKDVDRRLNLQNTGLLYSAKATIDDIKPYSMLDSSKMVEVEMKSNVTGDIVRQKIAIGDYKKMDCTAFPNLCKKYKGKNDCEPCFVKEKVKESMHHMISSTKNDMNNKLYYHDFGLSNAYPLYLYNINETPDSVVESDNDSENDNNNKININNSALTFYLGGLTIVGLYIVYRFLNKNK
jgi:hypothetical protein